MKNTKNLLITGLVLATTLFLSVQMFADLTMDQLNLVREEMGNQREGIKNLIQIRNLHRQNGNNGQADLTQKRIDTGDTKIEKLQKLYATKDTYLNIELSDKIKRIKSGQ